MVYLLIFWYAFLFFCGGCFAEYFKEAPNYLSNVYPAFCYGTGMLVWKLFGVRE